jgi:hypothetical protein
MQDLAMLTGATVINEDLGDDMDLIKPEFLGECVKSVSTETETILQVDEPSEEVEDVIADLKEKIKNASSPG